MLRISPSTLFKVHSGCFSSNASTARKATVGNAVLYFLENCIGLLFFLSVAVILMIFSFKDRLFPFDKETIISYLVRISLPAEWLFEYPTHFEKRLNLFMLFLKNAVVK